MGNRDVEVPPVQTTVGIARTRFGPEPPHLGHRAVAFLLIKLAAWPLLRAGGRTTLGVWGMFLGAATGGLAPRPLGSTSTTPAATGVGSPAAPGQTGGRLIGRAASIAGS
jgi:hypothetical protein